MDWEALYLKNTPGRAGLMAKPFGNSISAIIIAALQPPKDIRP